MDPKAPSLDIGQQREIIARYLQDSVFNPTTQAIDDILRRSSSSPLLTPYGGGHHIWRSIFDLGDGRVLKYGPRVGDFEGLAMRFVADYTSIPVSHVFLAFKHEGTNYIVMEKVEAYTLADAEHSSAFTDDDDRAVLIQLSDVMAQLRNLGRLLGCRTFGSWPDSPYNNTFFYHPLPGEINSLDEFHRYWERIFERDYYVREGPALSHLRDILAATQSLQPSYPVLSHGDLSCWNILVKGNKIIALIDFEMFGWYPDFWNEIALRQTACSERLNALIKEMLGPLPKVTYAYTWAFNELENPAYVRY